jgi:RNA polymerase sigma-70 factor (sigma-E family)
VIEPSFEERFPGLLALAYRVAYRLLGDRGDAEDVAQEAVAVAHADWAKVSVYSEPFVARVASRLAIARWRRRRPTTDLRELDAEASGEDEATVLRFALIAALRRLPAKQRDVVVLRFIADLPEAAVAEVMGTTVGTVKQHCHRGLARLRGLLSDHMTLEVGDVREA